VSTSRCAGILIYRSLSPKCTPLKQRYDSCFNAWFEGYLQPALDSAPRRTIVATPLSAETVVNAALPQIPQEHTPRIITSWASAFTKRPIQGDVPETLTASPASHVVSSHPIPTSHAAVDVQGKTRAQVKAEEYERNCGQAWKEYHACLTVRCALNIELKDSKL